MREQKKVRDVNWLYHFPLHRLLQLTWWRLGSNDFAMRPEAKTYIPRHRTGKYILWMGLPFRSGRSSGNGDNLNLLLQAAFRDYHRGNETDCIHVASFATTHWRTTKHPHTHFFMTYKPLASWCRPCIWCCAEGSVFSSQFDPNLIWLLIISVFYTVSDVINPLCGGMKANISYTFCSH